MITHHSCDGNCVQPNLPQNAWSAGFCFVIPGSPCTDGDALICRNEVNGPANEHASHQFQHMNTSFIANEYLIQSQDNGDFANSHETIRRQRSVARKKVI